MRMHEETKKKRRNYKLDFQRNSIGHSYLHCIRSGDVTWQCRGTSGPIPLMIASSIGSPSGSGTFGQGREVTA